MTSFSCLLISVFSSASQWLWNWFLAWFQASVTKWQGTALFWVVTQRVVVISYFLNYHYLLRNNPEKRSALVSATFIMQTRWPTLKPWTRHPAVFLPYFWIGPERIRYRMVVRADIYLAASPRGGVFSHVEVCSIWKLSISLCAVQLYIMGSSAGKGLSLIPEEWLHFALMSR